MFHSAVEHQLIDMSKSVDKRQLANTVLLQAPEEAACCHPAVAYQFIDKPANIDNRQPGYNVFAHHHTVDKALSSMAEVGAHEPPRGAEGPALGRGVPVLQAQGHQGCHTSP